MPYQGNSLNQGFQNKVVNYPERTNNSFYERNYNRFDNRNYTHSGPYDRNNDEQGDGDIEGEEEILVV